MSPVLAASIVGVCLLTEGFFSGSEIAVVSADRLKLKTQAEAGHKGSQLALKLLERPERLLGTCLIGTNLSTVTASTAATAALVTALPDAFEAITVAILFPLILLFGELIPKSIYQHYADRLAPVISLPLSVASTALFPALVVLEWLTRLMTGGQENTTRPVTREDIVLLLEGSDEVRIDQEDRELIQRVFEFGEAVVEDAMKPLIEVSALPETATARDAVEMMVSRGHSRIPVFDERIDRVTGIVHHSDLLHNSSLDQPLRELARPPFFVPESKDLEALFVEFNNRRQRIAIPVDEYGGAVGLITMEDILEEIVGDIGDETDKKVRAVRQIGPHSWLARGRVETELLLERTGFEIPEGYYETLAGFILSRLGHVPVVGETLQEGEFTLEVTRASDRAILQVKLQRR
ncbi:MAG: hemolysin family protein [Myxococcota bacterium]|nr:hemolysin family protein [Myxococcota bacterium]